MPFLLFMPDIPVFLCEDPSECEGAFCEAEPEEFQGAYSQSIALEADPLEEDGDRFDGRCFFRYLYIFEIPEQMLQTVLRVAIVVVRCVMQGEHKTRCQEKRSPRLQDSMEFGDGLSRRMQVFEDLGTEDNIEAFLWEDGEIVCVADDINGDLLSLLDVQGRAVGKEVSVQHIAASHIEGFSFTAVTLQESAQTWTGDLAREPDVIEEWHSHADALRHRGPRLPDESEPHRAALEPGGSGLRSEHT